MDNIIGREVEIAKLAEFALSNKPEFVAVYGRRRVGKTFLVRSAFKDKFAFYATGVIEGTREQEMEAFNTGLRRAGYEGEPASTWMEAFDNLAVLLKKRCNRRKSRQIVFIDELSCFDTVNSGFISALDFFWNSVASWMDNVMLVVCGSATSWMLKNLIYSYGGLNKRLTHHIHLHPFNLAVTEKYCRSKRGKWDRMSILQAYSIIGGVPYYLSLLDFNVSVAENIDRLFFSGDAMLKDEYYALYRSMYTNPEAYISIIEQLAKAKQGMTRNELIAAVKASDNGHFGDMLENLISCDFIRMYNNGGGQNGGIYQLIDFFTLFYHQFGKRKTTDNHYWSNMLNDPKQNNFYGLAFERVCMSHFRQVIHSIGVSGIHSEFYSWRSKNTTPAVQIDMVLDRSDGVVNICEAKYSRLPYVMSKSEAEKIERREAAFQTENKNKQWTQVVIITTKGMQQNLHSSVVQKEVTLDDLFVDVRE